MRNKKGFTLQQMAPIAISFIIIAIVLGIGATVVSDVQWTQFTDNCAEQSGTINNSDIQAPFCANSSNVSLDESIGNSYAYNSSGSGLEAINTLADWLPTIGVIVAASVVIGIIVAYFKF